MNRCLRSLSCLLAVTALALFATNATARRPIPSNSTPRKPDKTPRRRRTRRSHTRQRNSLAQRRAEKRRHARQCRCEKAIKAGKGYACSQGGRPAAHGRSGAGEGSDRSRAQGQDRRGDRHTEQDRGPGGAETRRMVHPAAPRDDGEFQPLCRVHRRQPGLAERGVAAPAGGGAAVAGAQRRGHGSRLHRRPAGQRQGQTRAGARAARRGRSRGRGPAGARRLAIGRIVGAHGDRSARDVPRPSHPRRPPRAHGQADRRQGSRGRQARRATPRRRRACDREGLCRGQGQSEQGAGCARRRRDRGASGSRLHAVPHPVDARPEQN